MVSSPLFTTSTWWNKIHSFSSRILLHIKSNYTSYSLISIHPFPCIKTYTCFVVDNFKDIEHLYLSNCSHNRKWWNSIMIPPSILITLCSMLIQYPYPIWPIILHRSCFCFDGPIFKRKSFPRSRLRSLFWVFKLSRVCVCALWMVNVSPYKYYLLIIKAF